MPEILSLKNKITSEGLEIEVCALTIYTSPISIIAIVYDPKNNIPCVSFGFSTEAKIELATLKALEEAMMVRNTLELKRLTQSSQMCEKNIKTFLDHVVYYSFPQQNMKWRFFLENKKHSLIKLKNILCEEKVNLPKIVGLFEEDVIYVDLTTPEVERMGYKVVRVIIPELQPLYENHSIKMLNVKRLQKLFNGRYKLNNDPHPYG